MKKILKTAGIFHLLYYALIISYAGIRTTFAGFWLAAGTFFSALSVLPDKWLSRLKLPLGVFYISGIAAGGHGPCEAGARSGLCDCPWSPREGAAPIPVSAAADSGGSKVFEGKSRSKGHRLRRSGAGIGYYRGDLYLQNIGENGDFCRQTSLGGGF